jgi:uncharacterized FlgJ-related protein
MAVIKYSLIALYSSFIILPSDYNKKEETEVNYESLYQEIVRNHIEYPEIVWAQAILESGNFKSEVFNSNKNLFGMKFPRRRTTTSIGSNRGYARYESWEESVKDYKLYQTHYFKDRKINRSQYFIHLNRVYCEIGSSYSDRVKKIIKKMYSPKFEIPDYLKDGIIEVKENSEDPGIIKIDSTKKA